MWRAFWSGSEIALKKIPFIEEELFQQQLSVLCKLNHPNIIRLYGWSKKDQEKYLVMELSKAGSLDVSN